MKNVWIPCLLLFVLVASCAKDEGRMMDQPTLPDVTPAYRSETPQIFGISFPSEFEAPRFDDRAQLGRVLFHDRMLSQNGAVSCNTCHLQSHGFAEPKALSHGLRRELTERNASHLANPGIQLAYFWDGRATDLTTQVTMPIENHVEMGFRSLESLVERLDQLDYYTPLFTAAYGDPEPSVDRIQDALSTFLSAMVTCGSKADEAIASAMPEFWDPWGVMDGSLTLDGLTALEKRGFELFHGEAQCANCHGGPHFNGWGMDFADIGLDAEPNENASTSVNAGGGFLGNWGPTAMKVPSLRNVSLTAPYMHDGRFATLDQVLDHYSHGIQDVTTLDPRLRNWSGSPLLGGDILIDVGPGLFPISIGLDGNEVPPVQLNFTPEERLALKAFLHSLTDHAFVQDERFSNPFTTP
jgi:cytochrome c peroxidase